MKTSTALVLSTLVRLALATSFLTEPLVRKGIHDVLDHTPIKHTDCKNAELTGPIETTSCDYETVESMNDELFSNLSELVKLPFFKYFQVDLYRECPFWPDDGKCDNPGCAITTIDESDVPEKWRSAALSEVDFSSIEKRHELPGCYYRDSDFCFLDDNTEGEYYDLSLVPERFTGYSGPDAHRIWRSIYEENCFGLSEKSFRKDSLIPDPELNLFKGKSPALVSLPDEMAGGFAGAKERQKAKIDHEEHCLEKRVYYRIISGLHSSITTHICSDYLNQKTGEWAPNLQCFIDRVATHPERLQYMYFNTVLMLRAVSRLGPYLGAYDYCSTGTHEGDQEALAKVGRLVEVAQRVGRFDESLLFQGENANILKEEFKTHFRNVSRIMDCVGCGKCRLWGKVQVTGVATAMKILFEMDEKALDPQSNANLLQRSEIVALMNTLYRFSESLQAVNKFRAMWKAMSDKEEEKLIKHAENHNREASKPQPNYSKPATASPGPRPDQPATVTKVWKQRLSSLADKCMQTTRHCLNWGAVNILQIKPSVVSPGDSPAGSREEL